MRLLFLFSLCLFSLTLRAERVYLALAGDVKAAENAPLLAALADASIELDRLHGLEVETEWLTAAADLPLLGWLDTTRDGRRILLKLSGFQPTPLVWDLLEAEGVRVLPASPRDVEGLDLLIAVVNRHLAETGVVRVSVDRQQTAEQLREPLAVLWAQTDHVAAVDIAVEDAGALLVRRKGAGQDAGAPTVVFGDLLAHLQRVQAEDLVAAVGSDPYAVAFSGLMSAGTGTLYEAAPWRWIDAANAALWTEKQRLWLKKAAELRKTVADP